MTSSAEKITIAGIVGAIISGIGFAWAQWSQVKEIVLEKPIVAVLAIAGVLLAGTFGVVRAVVRPTDRCRTCGYSLAGLEASHIDTATRPFDQARCPECGRLNTVEADKQD
jgi:phage FluMu protein Com